MLRTGIILIYEIESSAITSLLTVRFKGEDLKEAKRLKEEREHKFTIEHLKEF